MSSSYARPPSPAAAGRRTVNVARSSNAPFINSNDQHDYPAPSRSSREYVSVPRTTNEPLDGGRVLALRQRSPPRRVLPDDYDPHARRRAPSLDPVDTKSRRPLNIIDSKSPTKTSRPIITRDADRPSSPLSKTGGAQLVEESYIMPASSSAGRHHHRHTSLTAGDKLTARDRERDRLYPATRESSTMRPPPPKVGRDDRDYAYEYTTPKEQVMRDLAPPQRRPRRESYTSARPTSMINLDRDDKLYSRLERDPPPSAYTKGYDGLGRSGSLRPPAHSRNEDIARKDSVAKERPREEREAGYRALGRSHHAPKDEYVVYPSDNPRHERPRKPIPGDDRTVTRPREAVSDRRERDEDRARRHHHRHHRDPEAAKDYEYRDDRDRRGEHEVRDRRVRDEAREPRDRDGDRDRDTHAGLLPAGGGLAAAGMAAEEARRQRYHEDSSRPSKDETRQIDDKPHGRADPDESDREERRRRRRREREKEELGYPGEPREQLLLQAQPEDEMRRREASQPETHSLREQSSYDRRPGDEEPSHPGRKHHRHRRSSRTQSDAFSDSSESSESGASGTRLARPPRVVTPVTDAESNVPKPPPKGILKAPREKFPEEPSSIREGVAPLDAAKKGIPADARWTRINRRLVNPEALEQEGVRFEEFPDHVIVLKVLSQEEIARYTQRTHEIRERRRQGHGSEASGSGRGGPSEAAGPL